MIFKKKVEVQFPDSIEFKGKKFEISVEIIKKRSSSARIKENKLFFRLSSYLSNKELENHFNNLLRRLLVKLEKLGVEEKYFLSFKEILERGEFTFANVKYFLMFSKSRGIRLRENVFYINSRLKLDSIEKGIIKKLIEIYTPRIEKYVEELNKMTFNFKIKEIVLKNVNSKWGHCTRDNRLMFNLKLLNAKKEILDYVIIHELAHIKVKNHSASFWKEVEGFTPNYKVLRKELRINPPLLFN